MADPHVVTEAEGLRGFDEAEGLEGVDAIIASMTASAPAPEILVSPTTGIVGAASSRRELRAREAQEARSRPRAKTVRAGDRTARPVSNKPKSSRGRRPRVSAASRRPARAPRAVVIATPAPVRVRVAGVRRRIAAKFATVGAMAGVGLILVATTVPANAFVTPLTDDAAASLSARADSGTTQELTVADAAAPVVTRDAYTAVSQQQQFASRSGNRSFSYSNNPAGTIQWPFPSGAPITSGFGPRHVAGCGFCSTNHQGLDFTPGSGYPINSIADGVVSLVEVSGGGLGNQVVVDHVVNGQKVQSVYGHMQYGSIKVAVGQSVTVGQVLGNVGSTGASTGAHLHLEIHLDGTPIDPFAWLQANAN